MKQILCLRYLLLVFLTVLIAGNVQSQTIRFEGSDGKLKVNGAVIDSKNLPESLNLQGAHFSMQITGHFPMRVEVNGKPYEIWEDRIAEGNKGDHIHYRMTVESEGVFSIESSAMIDNLYGLANTLSQQVESVFSSVSGMENWDSLGNALHSFAYRSNPGFNFQAPPSPPVPGNLPQNHDFAARMLEFSNYLTNVKDASSELFELLSHEWRQEAEASEMAMRIRALEQGDERDEAIEELRAKLEEIFSMKQENRRMEIRHLEMELERMEDRLRERSQAKERLIDARLDELLGNKR